MICGNAPMDSHRTDQMLENAAWLEYEQGLHIDLVCIRLGVTRDQLEKARDRRRRAESHTDKVA